MKNTAIVNEALDFIREHFVQNLSASFVFHNYEYIEEVVSVARKISIESDLEQEDFEKLLLAAAFQHVGYVAYPDDVPASSARIAAEFLRTKSYDEATISDIQDLITADISSDSPYYNLKKILHDSSYSYLGRKRFFKRAKLLRIEREYIENRQISTDEWDKYLLDLLVEVKFYTPYGQREFITSKLENISLQRQILAEDSVKETRKKTGKDLGRGVDTLFRITLRNHNNLSSIADGKANMIISINTLVLSIFISVGTAIVTMRERGSDLDIDAKYLIPVIALMISSLTAIIFAVLSAIPSVKGNDFTEEEVSSHKVSLLFFGNFLKIGKQRFVDYLGELKRNQDALYETLSKDLYNLGFVLRRKYRLLTIAYRVFVGGLILSVVLFLIVSLVLK